MEDDEIVQKIKTLIADCPFGYFQYVFSNKNPELKTYVLEHSKFLDDKVDSKTHKPYAKSTRICYAVNNLEDYPKCKTCGNPIMRNIAPTEDIHRLFCSNRCAQKDPDNIAKGKATKLKNHGDPNYNNKAKSKKTCLERYGVECSWQSDKVKEASKKTLLEHYGVDHPMHSDGIKSKMRSKYKEQHGVEFSFQNPKVQEKIKAKNQEKYGVDYPMQCKKLHDIMHKNSAKTQKTNTFKWILENDKDIEPMFTLDEWLEHASCDRKHVYTWKCKKCGKVFQSHVMYGCSYYARCYDCNPVLKPTSDFEREVTSFIKSLDNGIEVLYRTPDNKQVIAPQEIDIIVKKDGKTLLLVEADGNYWHSAAAGKDMYYHLDKTDRCNALGCQLVHLFEDEWRNKQDIAKSRLKSLLGVYDQTVFARKCIVKELSSAECRDFFNATHLQGSCQSSIRYGLFYNDELVAAMSFGMRRKITNGHRNEGEFELLRFSTKLGCHVVGGAGKLLAHFEKECKPSLLISYADRRWSKGKLYEALGFTLDHVSAPNYWYMRNNDISRIYRYAFRKSMQSKLLEKFDPNKTEIENMVDNGYNYIWDCGNYVFMKKYSKNIL